ncbi:MAG: sulfotransferase [Sphingomonas taxi]
MDRSPPPTLAPNLAALKAALARRDRPATTAAVAALLAEDAPLGPQWQALAQLMLVSGEVTLADRAMDAFVAAAGRHPPALPAALYARAVLLADTGRFAAAEALLRTLPADVPDPAEHAAMLGRIAMVTGRSEAARTHFTTALDHRPGWGSAWLSLGTAIRLGEDPLGARLLAEAPAAARQPADEQARYHYALGRYHDERGDADAAFAAFARGAALLRGQAPYRPAVDAAHAREAMTGWPDDLSTPATRPGRDTGRPIFVTGLPRSGTTLVEQILASHSAVADGGELNLVQHLAVAAGGVSGTALARHRAQGGTPEALGDLYLHLLAERFGAAGRIVDKTIDAGRCMGLIASALPDAPLIWMRRDPLDCAWSCFHTFFRHGSGWSYDLADIAHHFRLEEALLAFWQARLGARLLVVPYEELVADPAGWTRRLLAHCGLAEEAAVHAPHRTERAVTSASTAQVRRPINRDGLGRAERYREYLSDFTATYQGGG